MDSVLQDGRKMAFIKMDSIEGVKEETFSAYKPNLEQILFMITENKLNGKKNSYAIVSQNVYNLLHPQMNKEETKKLKNLVKQMNIKAKTLVDSIRLIEGFVKSNFAVKEGTDLEELSGILDNKSTDEVGISKLFAAIFDNVGIQYEAVLTCNRFSLRFDPSFEAYDFLETYLFYFPRIQQYISPVSITSRLDNIPYGYQNNYGLFIHAVSLGTFKTGLGEIRFIKPDDYKKNQENHIVTVDFSKSMENPDVHMSLVFMGQYAQQIQPYYSFIPPTGQDELNNSILNNMLKDAVFTNVKVENKGIENLGIKPFIIQCTCKATGIIESAGDKFLFKVGELIGPQVELYQEEKRQFDIENEFNRSYNRTITFDIPTGYTITNPESLKMNVVMMDGNEASSSFISDYTIKDRTVTISIVENYKKLTYDKSSYEDFRKVVNASADFNKVILVFSKSK